MLFGGRRVGVLSWLLVWLILNALVVAWRLLVTAERSAERDRKTEREDAPATSRLWALAWMHARHEPTCPANENAGAEALGHSNGTVLQPLTPARRNDPSRLSPS